MKRRDLEKHLKAHGCLLHHHGSRHEIWLNPVTGDQEAVPRHREVNTITARAICKGLNVPLPPTR